MRALSLMLALAVGASGAAGCSSATHPLPPEARGDGPATPGASLRAEAVVLAMTAVADWQLAHMSAYDPIGWLVAPFWAGIVTFAPLSNNPTAYFEAARANGRRNAWQPGPRPFLADDHAITQSYFMLYLVDRDARLIAPSLARLDRGRYEPVVRSGWAALARAIQPDGRLGYAQSPSDRPGRANATHAEVYASGAFLLAGTEVYRLVVRAGP